MIGNGELYKKRLFKGWLVYSFKLWISHFFIYKSDPYGRGCKAGKKQIMHCLKLYRCIKKEDAWDVRNSCVFVYIMSLFKFSINLVIIYKRSVVKQV